MVMVLTPEVGPLPRSSERHHAAPARHDLKPDEDRSELGPSRREVKFLILRSSWRLRTDQRHAVLLLGRLGTTKAVESAGPVDFPRLHSFTTEVGDSGLP